MEKKNCVEIGNGLLPIEHEAGRWARRWARCWGAQGVCVARSGRVGGKELGAGARAVGERQRRWGAQDERACRQLGGTAPACWACWAARRLRAGRAGRARQAGVSGRGAAGRAGGARQAGTRGAAGERGTAGLGVAWAQPVRAGWASWPGWGFVHSDSVFFGPVRLGSFLSHQMNTVHWKINFRKKKYFIKFN